MFEAGSTHLLIGPLHRIGWSTRLYRAGRARFPVGWRVEADGAGRLQAGCSIGLVRGAMNEIPESGRGVPL